ncbi:MAG: HNH endonuclease [Ruminococcus sp.]|nr:HNH endonuclease [Ruminococcus sp.]
MDTCKHCGKSLSDAQFLLLNDTVFKSCPHCSTGVGEHVFYKCPDAFGTTKKRITDNNPMGLQSYCASCRAKNKGPHENAVFCSDVKDGYIINEIRFLPMGSSVFPTYEDAKDFITDTMPSRGDTFYYINTKMNCPENTFVLFQYGGKLIGYAVYINTVDLDEPVEFEDGNLYNGYYQFAPGSITFLDSPITKEDFAKIDTKFKSFGQSYQKKPVGLLPAIFGIINGNGGGVKPSVYDVSLPEEIEEKELGNLVEGVKKHITVNAYERNKKARIACINHYRKKNNGRLKCEICGFDFGEVYGDEFKTKIHIHHLVEISSIGAEYKINPSTDLIPICPNCHYIAHSKKPAYTPDEIKAMLRRNS